MNIVYAFDEEYSTVESKIEYLIENLKKQAEKMGADAIVNLNISSASTYTEDDDGGCQKPDIIIYGTAVKIKRVL